MTISTKDFNTRCGFTSQFSAFVDAVWLHEKLHVDEGKAEAAKESNNVNKIIEPFTALSDGALFLLVDAVRAQTATNIENTVIRVNNYPNRYFDVWLYDPTTRTFTSTSYPVPLP